MTSPSSNRPIVVTGMGVVTPFGPGTDRFWEGIVRGESRIGEHDRIRLASGPTLSAPMPDEYLDDIDTRYGGHKNAWAIEKILAETLKGSKLGGRGAVFFGNAFNGEASREPQVGTRWLVDHWATWLKEKTGAETACSVLTACSTANTTISLGASWIADGHCDWAIVGAMEMLYPDLINTFEVLRMTSRTGCRPFVEDRDGTVLGDGAGMILLESAEHAARRKARPIVELAGFGLMTDGGMGKFADTSVIRAMLTEALASARLAPSDVDFINSAATGSLLVDDLELDAMRAVFGASPPIVYSVKSLIGQSIGGTGAVEAIATILSLWHQDVPAALTDPRGPKLAPGGRLEVAFNNSIAMTGHMCATVFRRVPS